MSLYADYLHEKTNDQIIENEFGFATYRYIGNDVVYIVDIYILPEFRKSKHASTIADNIVELASKKGCTKLMGSIVPSNKNSTDSLKVLLAYGMKLESSTTDFIAFTKDI